ncbi:hypothetical protein, partial [Pseudomonas sp. MPR-AND1A]|uniref:hypothetical protein n=1 Tax=Pseudomonas sp. MPR-AND1A TaxID=2070600 RepID=UPI001C45D5AC
ILPMYGVIGIVSLIFYPVLYATMSRAILRPSENAMGYIRLGGDEVRQLLLILLWVVVGIAAEIATVILFVVLGIALHGSPAIAGLV